MPALSRIRWLPWVVPIAAVALCALMVLPGGAFLASAGNGSLHGSMSSARGSAGSPLLTAHLAASQPSPASIYSGLSPTLQKVPWLASLAHNGKQLAPLTSLPNLALLQHPPSVQGHVNPFYVAQPAPLGIADFGLGAHTYSYNVTRIQGAVTLNAAPNVTDPASDGLIEPGGAADGNVGSYNEFGVQLNTVTTNMSIPGSDRGFFWTQNVYNWNDTGIHPVSDTFNLTSGTQNPFVIEPNTIYSACGLTTQAGIDKVLTTYGGVFQCVGGTIPVSPASYPVTLQLFNNASVNSQGRTQISYGYRVTEAGTGTVYTGVSDVVVFNSPSAPTPPANKPGFSIDGFHPSPAGLFRDAEMVLVGDIGGDNSVFRSIHGSVSLWYENSTKAGWSAVPSAYNFGGDTGETSTGIADYWTPSHTVMINQGPAMLYGLWNAVPWASVASGDIQLSGSVTPNYGFVFVSNSAPVKDPRNSSERDNFSWLPTTSTGSFHTYLPPLGAPWTTQYWVEGFADGFAQKAGHAVTGSTLSYHLHLASSPGTLNAPLEAWSNAQAANLATHVTGSSAAPYTFSNLVVNENFTFEHVNDYAYATFPVMLFEGVTNPVVVNNTWQGVDSPAGNFILYDDAAGGSTGLLTPGGAAIAAPYATSGINIFNGGHGDVISNQTTAADGYGLQVNLWKDSDVSVHNITSVFGAEGVWVGESTTTSVSGVVAQDGSNAVTDIASVGTTASDLTAIGAFSFAAYELSTTDSFYQGVSALDGAQGVVAGQDYGASAAYDPYYYLAGANGLLVADVLAYNGSVGVNATLSSNVGVGGVYAEMGSFGVRTDHTTEFASLHVRAADGSWGVYLWNTHDARIRAASATGGSVAVWVGNSGHVSIDYVLAQFHSVGVEVWNSMHVSINNVRATHHSTAVVVL